jgi:hypothetical protein
VQDDPRLRTLLGYLEEYDRHDPQDSLVRQIVRLRARDACEYCLLPTTGQFQIDHVIPAALWSTYAAGQLRPALVPIAARRGPDHLDNFAWCCAFCNLGKRQQVTYRIGAQTLRLFDPRHDRWMDHFTFANSYLLIVGITPIGVATQRALGLNTGELNGPLGTRHDAILDGRYPPPWAMAGAS